MPFPDLLTHALGSLAQGSSLLSPIPSAAVDAWERLRGVPVSPEIRALCTIAGGLRKNGESGEEIRFLGGTDDPAANPFSTLLPLAEEIGNDGRGNSFLLDAEDGFGLAGPVYLAVPAAGAIVIAARSLLDFLREVFLQPDCGEKLSALEKSAFECRAHKDFAPEAFVLRTAQDAALRALCMQIPDDARIYDLRTKEPGSGFPWASFPSATRDPVRPLFVGLPPDKRASVLSRLFGI